MKLRHRSARYGGQWLVMAIAVLAVGLCLPAAHAQATSGIQADATCTHAAHTHWSAKTGMGNDASLTSAVDGNLKSVWRSVRAQRQDNYVQFDLFLVHKLDGIVLDAVADADNYARSFSVSLSTDTVTWQTVATVTAVTPQTVVRFPSALARYVQIALLAEASAKLAIGEFDVCGKPNIDTSGTIRITAVGDSLTQGNHLPLAQAWPAQLQLLLPGAVIVNAGSNGATARQQASLWYGNTPGMQTALNSNPNIVIIMLGTNDGGQPWNWKPLPKVRNDFVHDYQALIDTFKQLPSKPRIVLAAPPGLFGGSEEIQNNVNRDIVPLIRKMAADNKLEFIDVFTPMRDKGALFSDGVHPTAAGSVEIAKVMKLAVLKYVK